MFAYKSSSAFKVVREKATYVQRQTLLGLLRQLRSDAGLTQAQLAARLDRDQTFVSKYEVWSAGWTC
jgi:hypothetical protein